VIERLKKGATKVAPPGNLSFPTSALTESGSKGFLSFAAPPERFPII